MKIKKISPNEHIFTKKLAEIDDPPARLYYWGDLPDISGRHVIGIVGTRKPTGYGKEVTYRLAYDLARKGFVIVSGLAIGVDAIAHQAALDAGGLTIAIIATPLPDIYPRTNTQLAKKIIANGGSVISESKEGDELPMGKFSFLQRNRLVSGLSEGVIITEAAAKSGTLNTASHALVQGREVFVVPGHITSPLSAGCNNLIKQGATPITSVDDVLFSLAPEQTTKEGQARLPIGDTPAENAILQLIFAGERDGETIQQKSGLSAAEFSTTLTMLEINGQIRALGANQWTIG